GWSAVWGSSCGARGGVGVGGSTRGARGGGAHSRRERGGRRRVRGSPWGRKGRPRIVSPPRRAGRSTFRPAAPECVRGWLKRRSPGASLAADYPGGGEMTQTVASNSLITSVRRVLLWVLAPKRPTYMSRSPSRNCGCRVVRVLAVPAVRFSTVSVYWPAGRRRGTRRAVPAARRAALWVVAVAPDRLFTRNCLYRP